MNKSSKGKCASFLALAAALVIPGIMPHSAHGMYDPKHGRWLQRDPAGYVDGMNLHQYVKSRPTRTLDPRGKWGADLHAGWTGVWAREEGMCATASWTVGDYDERTDTPVSSAGPLAMYKYSGQSWLLPDGQGYHFNSNATGADSRRVHQYMDLRKALGACERNDDPEEAARWLGHGLHALQDWWAHGDWAKGRFDIVHHGFDLPYDDWHYDATGPVYWVYSSYIVGQPSTPDYQSLNPLSTERLEGPAYDAPNGKRPVNALPEGRPAQVFGFDGKEWYDYDTGKQAFDGSWWEARWPLYAWGNAGNRTWIRGSQRFNGTKRESKAYIQDFLGKICKRCNNGVCPKCQCYFLNFNRLEGGGRKWCWR